MGNWQNGWRSGFVMIALLVSWLGCSEAVWALDPRWAITQYGHDIWLRQNGLPASAVSHVFPSRSGYVWLTTSAGLIRFDGANFKTIRISNHKENAKESVSVVLETATGALWVGTQTNGLRLIERDRIREFGGKDGLDEEIRALHEGSDGRLWVGTANGLFVFDAQQFKRLPTANDYICGITQDKEGVIYVAHHAGVEIIQGGRHHVIGVTDGLPSPRVWSVSKDRQGSIWIGTEEGLCIWQQGQAFPVKFSRNPHVRAVNIVHEDKDGNLWIGTRNGGLYRFANDRWSELNVELGLSNNYVQSLGEDREGSLWIATNDGLNRLRNISIVPYTTKEGLPHDSVRNLVESAAGTLYIFNDSTPYFSMLRNGQLTNVPGPWGPAFAAPDGSIWLAGTNGLRQLRGTQLRQFLPELKGHWISCVGADEQSLVIYVDKVGLRRFINGHLEPLRLKDGSVFDSTDYQVTIKQDRQGNLWVGGTSGLLRFHQGRYTKFTTDNGLADNWITSIDEAPDGSIWVGTMRGGIARYRGDHFVAFTTLQGVPDNQALCVLNDLCGNVWVSSPRGLFSLTRHELEQWEAGRLTRLQPRVFGVADGMKTEQGHFDGSPAGWRRKDGTLWFATKKGAVMVDPQNILTNALPPPVLIEELIMDGQTYPPNAAPDGWLRLKPGTDRLEIHYNALSLLAPERVLFRYQLKGIDNGWIEAGHQRSAHYTHLPPGDYEFQVMACNNDGVWATANTPLRFSVLPQFWQTWWFFSLALLTGSGLLYLGIRWRLQQLKRHEAALSVRVQERTQALQLEIAERRRAESELREAQDFLRNVINNVPSMIFVKDSEGRYKLVNEACADLYGTTVAQLLGKTDADFKPPAEELREIMRIDREVLETMEERVVTDQQVTDAQGVLHWLHTIKRPFVSGTDNVRYLLGISTDFSERKILETQLRHAQKLESIGQLAAGIAHEINTPTQYVGDNTRFVRDAFHDINVVIERFTELLDAAKHGAIEPEMIAAVEEEIKRADIEYLTEEVPQAIHQSLDGVNRIAMIVQSMKAFAHPGGEGKRAADLNKAIESTLTVARNEWKYVAEVELQLDANLPQVPCYLGEFNQVMLNLIINATHAIADVVGDGLHGKGKITISTHSVDSHWVEIRVRDTGQGIPPEIQERIFDPFFTTKEVGKGTGQGLAISHSVIVEKHKGEIRFETEAGKGTTFIIRLPRCAA